MQFGISQTIFKIGAHFETKANEALKILKSNTFFRSRLGFCYDPPMLGDDGKPLVFDPNFDFYTKTHDAFADAGVKIHTCIVHAGWTGVDTYDYSLCDSVLDAVFRSGKVEYFIPRIKLNVPVEWCRRNPSEVCADRCYGRRECSAVDDKRNGHHNRSRQ